MKLLVVAAAIILMASNATSSSRPTVKTEDGRVQGQRSNAVNSFYGLPYAAPPVGDSRWRAPSPADHWTGVRSATQFKPACMQTGVSMPGEAPPRTSEDCLYLNVWTPARSASSRLPVMVFIHGGGFSNGSAAMPLYWGDRLAHKGVIVVNLGYRLGPFGFLALPELTAESEHKSSGDYGLLDQLAALGWVERNIAAFGGDAHRVTIFGQSAGGMSVNLLLSSPLSTGLFQRAISESGGVFEPMALAPDWLLPGAERSGKAYAASLNATSIAELRRLPASRLLEGKAGTITHHVIDGFVLPRAPYDVFAQGRQIDVPTLIGSNDAEARSLMNPSDVTAATYAAGIRNAFGPLPAAMFDTYPHATDVEAKTARLGFERDLRFGWDMWTWAKLQSATGKQPVFYYRFTQNPPFPTNSIYAGWGPSHFAELWYVFDHLDQEPWRWDRTDRSLADAISSYWVNFAKTGNPNAAPLPLWPKFTEVEPNVLNLGDPLTVTHVAGLDQLDQIDRVYKQLRPNP